MVGVAETSGWYDPAVYPELRSAAPWVMEDMIEAQVMLPEALGNSPASSAPLMPPIARQVGLDTVRWD